MEVSMWEYDFMLLELRGPDGLRDFFEDLNRRGRDGWEAIGLAPYQWLAHGKTGLGAMLEAYANPTLLVILKRPAG
jgi:hypothetical protein